MPTILFVCSVNRFRSVIAEGQFRQLLISTQAQGNWIVGSAGTWAQNGLPPVSQALRVGKTRGLELGSVRSREVTLPLLEGANLIIPMTRGQKEALCIEFPSIKCRIILFSEICDRQSYDVSDPMENPAVTWEEVGNEICDLLSSSFDRICKKATQAEECV